MASNEISQSSEDIKKELPKEHKGLYISTKLIRSNPHNPRTKEDIENDTELFDSIKIRGVETPIHVRPIEADRRRSHLRSI